jgi:hypothetical protein
MSSERRLGLHFKADASQSVRLQIWLASRDQAEYVNGALANCTKNEAHFFHTILLNLVRKTTLKLDAAEDIWREFLKSNPSSEWWFNCTYYRIHIISVCFILFSAIGSPTIQWYGEYRQWRRIVDRSHRTRY